LALPWQGRNFLASKADLTVLALGLFFFVIVALRFLPGGRAIISYATTDGLVFRLFAAAGITPWSQVQGFHRQEWDRVAMAPEILVADVFGDQDWSKGVGGTKTILPPGTLASAKNLDLTQLESALEAMRAQCLQQATPPARIQTKENQSQEANWGGVVALIGILLLAVAVILHQRIAGSISFPEWLRWVTPDWLMVYGLLGFLLYRKFRAKPIC
jgi:hypothetical protein